MSDPYRGAMISPPCHLCDDETEEAADAIDRAATACEDTLSALLYADKLLQACAWREDVAKQIARLPLADVQRQLAEIAGLLRAGKL